MHFAEIYACNSIIIRRKRVLLFLTISLEIISTLFVAELIRLTFPSRKQTAFLVNLRSM